MNWGNFQKYPNLNNASSLHKQKGGASDWQVSSNSVFVRPDLLSRYTLELIDQAPMFNPLQTGTKIPTPTTGIYPQGIYYMDIAARQQCKELPQCTEPGAVKRVVRSQRETLIDDLKRAMM